MALVQGDPIRARYLRAVDLVGLAERLRALFAQVEDAPAHGPAPDLLEQALSYLRVPTIYNRRVDTSGGTPWGPLGSREFYLGLCREASPDDWHLPTVAERDDLADQIHEQRRVARVKASAQ